MRLPEGGLPAGRPTLLCGGPGCGKTLFAVEFIVKGATLYNEPGVFMTFEEKAEELTDNVASLGFDLDKLVKIKSSGLIMFILTVLKLRKQVNMILMVYLSGLEHAIDSIGAKRVVLDTIENLLQD